MSKFLARTKTIRLSLPVLALLLSGCQQLPLMKFQDNRYKDSPTYLSRDPRKNPNAPRDLTPEEMKPKQ